MNYFRIKENSFIARLAAKKLCTKKVAMVVGKTIHLYGATKPEFLADERWVRHELKHVEQYQRYGFIGFLFRYIIQTARHGYYNCVIEKEARDAETDTQIIARFNQKQEAKNQQPKKPLIL